MVKSNLPIIEKTLTKRKHPQQFWVPYKGSAAAISLKTTALWCHHLRYSESELPFFCFWLKMNAIENKNSNHLAAPCLPPYHVTAFAMIQLRNQKHQILAGTHAGIF